MAGGIGIMAEPLTPEQAKQTQGSHIPDFVIQAFNELIQEKLLGNSATIMQAEAVARVRKLSPKRITKEKIYANRWLDVEPVFRRAGWQVHYDKPAYNETYEPSFEFRIK